MISRWEDVAKRVASNLQLDESVVFDWITQMCRATLNHARHPEVMETEFIGLGYIQARFTRILPTKKYLQDLLRIKRKYLNKYSENPIKFSKQIDRYSQEIMVIERDIASLSRFLDQKREIYDSGGKKLYRDRNRATGKIKKRFKHQKFTLSDPELHKDYYHQKGRKKKTEGIADEEGYINSNNSLNQI